MNKTYMNSIFSEIKDIIKNTLNWTDNDNNALKYILESYANGLMAALDYKMSATSSTSNLLNLPPGSVQQLILDV